MAAQYELLKELLNSGTKLALDRISFLSFIRPFC